MLQKSLLLRMTCAMKSLSSLCFPVYLVQNITFFKIYLQFAQIENGYKLQPIRLGKIIVSLPHGPRPEV